MPRLAPRLRSVRLRIFPSRIRPAIYERLRPVNTQLEPSLGSLIHSGRREGGLFLAMLLSASPAGSLILLIADIHTAGNVLAEINAVRETFFGFPNSAQRLHRLNQLGDDWGKLLADNRNGFRPGSRPGLIRLQVHERRIHAIAEVSELRMHALSGMLPD